jgi:hypothetical protein
MELTTYEVLKAARDWLGDRKNWIKYQRRGVGSKSIPDPPRCMLGAIDRVLWGPGQPIAEQQRTTDRHPAVAALALECQTAAGYFPRAVTKTWICPSIVAAFNDSANHARVVALLDLALGVLVFPKVTPWSGSRTKYHAYIAHRGGALPQAIAATPAGVTNVGLRRAA